MADLSTTKVYGDLTVSNIIKGYRITSLDGISTVYENRDIAAGNGLSGGGTLENDITITMGTPTGLTANTTNSVTATSHTHSISTASAVSLSNSSTSTTGTSSSLARADHTHAITGFSLDTHNHDSDYQPLDGDLSSIAGLSGTSGLLRKTAANTWELDTTGYTTNVGTVTSVSGGDGLTGTVTTSGSLTLGTPSTITTSTVNIVTVDSHTHALTLPATMPPSSHAITAHTASSWKTFYSNATSIVELSLGGDGTYLRSSGASSVPSFSSIQASDVPTLNQNTTGNAATATSLSGGATGSIPYQSAVNNTVFLAKGTDGQVLKLVSGLPAWGTDNNTTYSAGTGVSLSGTTFNHTNSITSGTASEGGSTRTLSYGGTFNIPSVDYDAEGHITAKGSVALTLPASDNTNYYPTAFSWIGGTSSGPTGSLTGEGMSTISFGAIPTASASASGIITTGTQTIAGSKTFNDTIISPNATTALRVNLSNSDTNIIRVNGSTKIGDSADYGFNIRYLGTLGGNENALAFMADNQEGTEVESFRIKQDGTIHTPVQIISTLPAGTSPFAVSSTTAVDNLNADLLDGNHASAFATAGHTHSSYNRASSILSGSSVFSDVTVADGVVTGTATRTLTPANIGAQPSNANLNNLSTLDYTANSFVKMTGENTFTLDTNTYLTGNQAITLSGDVSGSGTTSIVVTVANDSHTHDTRYYTETESDSKFVNVTGDTMTGDLTIEGALYATSKSFRIKHPTKEGKTLTYGSLEGPENAIYVRGRTQGKTIELPGYWENLIDEDTITVQITPIGVKQHLVVKSVSNKKVEIQNKKLFGGIWMDYYYFIQAERKDIPKLEVEA